MADIFDVNFLLNLIFHHWLFPKFLIATFIEYIIFLCHHNKCYRLLSYLPGYFLVSKKFYKNSYGVSVFFSLNYFDEKYYINQLCLVVFTFSGEYFRRVASIFIFTLSFYLLFVFFTFLIVSQSLFW